MGRYVVLLLLLIMPLSSFAAPSNVLFEGWFQIFVGKTPIGYMTQRYEFKNKKFYATQFLKIQSGGVTTTESLKAQCKDDFTPISFSYSSKDGPKISVINGKVRDGIMTVNKVVNGQRKDKVTKRLRKGTFLASFLTYMLLSQKGLLKNMDKKYDYYAIAEEEGVAYTGTAWVKKKESVQGKKAIKMLNMFKKEKKGKEDKFFVWLTPQGQPLLLRSATQNLEVRFANSQSVATNGFEFEPNSIRSIFDGRLPLERKGKAKTPVAPKTVKTVTPKKKETKATPPKKLPAKEVSK